MWLMVANRTQTRRARSNRRRSRSRDIRDLASSVAPARGSVTSETVSQVSMGVSYSDVAAHKDAQGES